MEQFFAVEFEVTGKRFTPEQERKPVSVVRPHVIIGNGIERGPEWDGLVRFLRFSLEIMREENRAVQAEAVPKLEVQLAALLGAERPDAKFLISLAEGRLERGLARVYFSARAVYFPRAEAAFFANKQNLVAAQDEEKVGALLRLPGFPIGHPN